MMARVETWDPPDSNWTRGLKLYMLDQLKISMHAFYEFRAPSIVNVRKYRKQAEDEVRRDEAALAALYDCYTERSAWLALLAQSVPPTGKGKLR